MRPLTPDRLTALLGPQQPPCVSLYQPTHRTYPASQQGPILYRNLVKQAEEERAAKRIERAPFRFARSTIVASDAPSNSWYPSTLSLGLVTMDCSARAAATGLIIVTGAAAG